MLSKTKTFLRADKTLESKSAGKIVEKKKRNVVPPPLSLSMDAISVAVQGLRNNSYETKDGPVFDSSVIAAFRGMFAAGKEYRFDLVVSTSVGSTAGGVILQTLAISPAVVSYQEWPALSALFDECNLIESRLLFQTQVGSDGSNLAIAGAVTDLAVHAVCCGPNLENISTTPTSYAAVLRLAGAVQVQRCVSDTSGVTVVKFRCPKNRLWASTVTPATQSPPAGILGSFDLAAQTTVTTSTVYYENVLRTAIVFRNRS
jgi:hypothetical protein